MALHILVGNHNVVDLLLLLLLVFFLNSLIFFFYTRTPPTHYYLESNLVSQRPTQKPIIIPTYFRGGLHHGP